MFVQYSMIHFFFCSTSMYQVPTVMPRTMSIDR